MAENNTKKCVLDFIAAFYAGNIAAAEQCCDNALTSLTYAPVEIFPHHGLKEGKMWLAQAVRIQHERYSARNYTIQSMVVDDNKAATMVEARLTKHADQRVLQFMIAEFFTLRDGLILEHRAFFDSLDFIQQLLGCDLTAGLASQVNFAMRS
jgi:ketosteroid isomerase-like protein